MGYDKVCRHCKGSISPDEHCDRWNYGKERRIKVCLGCGHTIPDVADYCTCGLFRNEEERHTGGNR